MYGFKNILSVCYNYMGLVEKFMDKGLRIYITRMKILSKNEDKKFYKKAYSLFYTLKRYGNDVVYVGDDEFLNFNYEGIYKLISSCNCLLAFTDRYTISSTWRASEVTYATDGMGIFEKVNFHIPVFLYTAIDNYTTSFFDDVMKRQDVYILPNNIPSAAQFIKNTMKKFH